MHLPTAPSSVRLWQLSGSRWLLAGSAMALAACTTTPLPSWESTPAVTAPTRVVPSPPPGPLPATIPQVTPIPPSTQLDPLPYSAAVAAQFPAPTERYNTPGLQEHRRSFTTNSELAEALQELVRNNLGQQVQLGLTPMGYSQRGQPLLALVATQGVGINPAALEETARPTVLLVAGQQGNTPASSEALLAIAQELGQGGLLAPLLDKINLILVPRANPDGFELQQAATADGVDLRFDHLLLQTPEARGLAQLVRDYHPAAVIDAGEFAAIEPTLERFGALRANDIGLQYAVTPNAHEFVTKAAREWVHQPAVNALRNANFRVDWNYQAQGSNAEAGFAMGTVEPITLRNSAALKNAAGLEIDSRGADLGRLHLLRRVHSQVTAINAVLRSTAERAANLQKVGDFVSRDIASQACRAQLVVQAQPHQERREVTLMQPDNGNLIQPSVAWTSALELEQPRPRPRPCGYWLSANALQAVERLELLGLQIHKVAEQAPVLADTYQEQANAAAAGPAGLRLVRTTPTRSTLDALPGSYYISMNQPLANLAAAALEPDTPYSYYAHGVLPTLGDLARVMAPPNLVYEEQE